MKKKKPNNRIERLVKDAKMRGGRAGQVIKDKTTYNRKKNKKVLTDDNEKEKEKDN